MKKTQKKITESEAKIIVKGLQGKQVFHDKHGSGTVIKVEDLHFFVAFADGVMECAYPGSFTCGRIKGNVKVCELVKTNFGKPHMQPKTSVKPKTKKEWLTPEQYALKYPFQGGGCTPR